MERQKIDEILMMALALCKADEPNTRNTALTNDLGQVITKHFRHRTLEVYDIKKTSGSTINEPANMSTSNASSNESQWQIYKPGSRSKKQNSVVQKDDLTQTKHVAEPELDDDNDALINHIFVSTPQQILDKFVKPINVKRFAKNLGLDINHELEIFEFIKELKNQITVIFQEEPVTDPEPVETVDALNADIIEKIPAARKNSKKNEVQS